ncbi:MAG: M14 family zinc carboxypeptidase, partial [bacterium]
FGVGSMGGHYTLQEVLQQLDSMRLLYPNLITVRDSIGRSVQGRGIWIAQIGSSQSAGKPEVLYTAIHHAREPMGMMSTIYYMWWLLENYNTNPEAAYLVNNRRQWFIPVVNPDGYEYNRSTNPNGGGFWRKNRRDNGSGVYGVDPNRNYGPMYMWNASNGGSSTSPSSDTYRGASPFSEPENQAIDNFMRTHNVKSALNYHTYGNYLIYPWGYLSKENGDSLIYRDWAYDMTAMNRFTNGTDQQTVNYSTRGNSDDYMYGDTTKPIAYTMTPEVGDETDGFWAPPARILPLAVANLPMNKRLAYIAGQFTTVIQHSILDGGGNGFLNRGETFSLIARVKNKGLAAGTVQVRGTSNSSFVQFSPTPVVLNPILSQQEIPASLNGTVSPSATEGIPVQLYVTITDGDGFLKIDTLNYFLGTPAIAFSDSASAGITNWNTGTGWGLTSSSHTPPSAFTDSPTGNYAANANNSLTLNSQINLNTYNFAQLKFWTKWSLEPTWDFATVELSTNNGSSWTTLRTELSHFGSARSGSMQPAGSWGFDSYNPSQNWLEQSVDLSAYINKQIKLRFRVAADGGDQRDGFYVDDIRVYGYTTSVAADTGVVITPASFSYSGITGRTFLDSVKIRNFTNASVAVAVSESLLTLTGKPSDGGNENYRWDLNALIRKLRPAFRDAHITRESFAGTASPSPQSPQAYTTILTDERGESGPGAADIYRVQYQYRTGILGSFHDFKIVLGNLPDSNALVSISVDTDQDFGTGTFPAPLGIGSAARDIGSEREVIIDASGILIDSLLGIGRIPAGVVVRTDSFSVVGNPFLVSVQRDSVFTISTETFLGGINITSFNDPDRKMNIGFVASHYRGGFNPLPDFAPAIAHTNIGGENGVSWISEDRTNVTIPPQDSASVRITTLAAKSAGTYRANIAFKPTGRPVVIVPITMNVTTPPAPAIQVSPTLIRDTLAVGDSITNIINVRNNGAGVLNYAVLDTSGVSWLTISPVAGTLDSGTTSPVSLKLLSAGLRIDTTYSIPILVISNDPAQGSVPVTLSLRVKRLTSVDSKGDLPNSFALHQNYPNPFNPSTNISYDLPKSSFVTLKVYNLIGQEVATLVNEIEDAGFKSVAFNSSALASGIYLYKLTAGDYVSTKKMILMK